MSVTAHVVKAGCRAEGSAAAGLLPSEPVPVCPSADDLLCDGLLCGGPLRDGLLCGALLCDGLLYDGLLYDSLFCDGLFRDGQWIERTRLSVGLSRDKLFLSEPVSRCLSVHWVYSILSLPGLFVPWTGSVPAGSVRGVGRVCPCRV